MLVDYTKALSEPETSCLLCFDVHLLNLDSAFLIYAPLSTFHSDCLCRECYVMALVFDAGVCQVDCGH